MADMVIDTTFNLNATQALAAVAEIGRRADAMLAKLGNTGIKIDTKPAETDLKELQTSAEKTFKAIGEDAEKSVSKAGGGGLFAGLKESFAQGQDAAGSGGGIFGSLAGTLGQLASPVGAVTAGIGLLTAGLAESFQVGAEFQKNMAAVSAITGITGAGLDDIGTRAQDLAAKFGGTATTQLESFQGVLSRFGAQLADTPDDLGKVSESINLLAKAGGIDAASAMDTLTTAMLQFGVDTSNSSELASESARFINVMAASARVGAAEIPQVGEAVKVAGVAMKGAKVSFEEGNAAIQVLAAGGKVGAEAGTALRNVLGKIAGEEVIPKEALAKLKSLGVDMKKVSDTSKPLADRLAELGKASKDATAFSQVFGSENAAAATILAQGAGTVRDWTKEITGTQDASKQAAINMGTFTEQIGRAKAAFENTLINVNKVLSPILAQVFGTLTQVFSAVYNAIAPVFSRLGATLGATFERIAAVAKPILAFIGGYIITYLVTTISAAGTILDALLQTAIKVFDGIIAAVQPIVVAFKKAFNITDDVTKSFDPLETFSKILTTITDVISFFGSILVEVGGFIAQWLIAPIRLGATVIGAIIEPLVTFGKHMLGVGEVSQSAGGFFSSFIDIVKQAPGFIRAVTAGFSAFVGGLTDLITNFSFDKLKNLLTGKTVSDAFIGSLDKDKLDKLQSDTAAQFTESLKRLTELRTKANTDKDKAQKEADAKAFDTEKERILNSITQKEKAGQLERSVAEKLRIDTQKLTLAAAKDDADAANAATDKAAKVKKEKLKDIEKDILKLNRETTKALSDAQAVADRSELSEAKQKHQKQVDDLKIALEKERQTLLDADKDKQDDDKISAEQKKQFHAATLALIEAKEKDASAKLKSINGEFADKQIELIDKQSKKQLSLQEDLLKKQIAQQKELGSNSTEEEMTRLADLNDLQIALLKATAEKKFATLVENNADVIKAGEDLKAALLTEDAGKIDAAKKTYAAIKEEARKSDVAVLEGRKQLNDDIAQQEKESALAIREAALSDIKDRSEKERQTRLLEVDKTLVAELEKAKGSFTQIQNAQEKAAAARLKIEADYATKSTSIFEKLQDNVLDIAQNMIQGFADSMGNTFTTLNSAFDKFAGEIEKRVSEIGKVDTAANDKEASNLLASLKAKAISFDDYQQQLAAINAKNQDAGVTATEKANVLIGKSFQGMAKTGNDALNLNLETMAKTAKENAKNAKKFGDATGKSAIDFVELGKSVSDAGENMALSITGTLGQMAAMGTLTLKSAGQAAAGIALDTVSKMVMVQAPAILAIFTGSIPPPFGFLAGLAAIAAVQVSLAAVKSAIVGDSGFYKGGDTRETPAGQVAGVVHGQEVIINHEEVNGEFGVFERLRKTLRSGVAMSDILNAYERPALSNTFVGERGIVTNYDYIPRHIPVASDAGMVSELRQQTAVLSNKLDAVLEATEAMPTAFRGNVKHEFKFHHDPSINIKKAAHEERRKALQ